MSIINLLKSELTLKLTPVRVPKPSLPHSHRQPPTKISTNESGAVYG